MNDIDIMNFANMLRPEANHIVKYEYEKSLENFTPVFDELDKICEQLSTVAAAHKYIILHGITNAAIDDFGVSLEAFGIEINFNSDVNKCLEGLGVLITRFWTSIKEAISRLIEYLRTDPYFSRWTNLNEMLRVKVSNLILARERYYALIDDTKFYNTKVLAIPYAPYLSKLNATALLTGKLNLLGGTPYESINVRERFGQELEALGFVGTSGVYVPPENHGFVAGTLRDFQWSPSKVHFCTDTLYRKLLVPHLNIDRMLYQMNRALKLAMDECSAVLRGSIDGDDTTRVNAAKARVQNIRAIKNIAQYSISMTRILATQWIRMVELYDLSKVKVGQ